MSDSIDVIVAGFVFGLLSAMPTGPVAFLIIQNTLKFGGRAGFMTLLGLNTGAAVYIALFVLGFGDILLDTRWLRSSVFIGGAVFLIVIAIQAWLAETTAIHGEPEVSPNMLAMFRESFLVTLTNPAIILLFAALIGSSEAAFGVEAVRELQLPLLIAQEVGVAIWFALVIGAVTWLPEVVAARLRAVVGRFASSCLALFGCGLLFTTVVDLIGAN